MDRHPAGSRQTIAADADYFTGHVLHDPIIVTPGPNQLRSLLVHFAPGARTNWHTHPQGQTIFVVSGVGRAQAEGGPVVALRPGDTVYFAPNERHWHGAAPDTAMSHIAMQVEGEEKTAWAEPVSEADYGRAPSE